MAWAIWVTGLPGSGKTTITGVIVDLLKARGVHAKVLNVDDVRRVLTPRPAYSEEERAIVYRAMAYMAKLLVDEGVNVIIDATGNLREYRDIARGLIPRFDEIYVSCPLDVAMRREAIRKGGGAPSGIYEKGRTGRSSTVPGLNVPYEPPSHPLATLESDKLSPEEAGAMAAKRILEKYGEGNG
jgi:adenylylsulfate kinase